MLAREEQRKSEATDLFGSDVSLPPEAAAAGLGLAGGVSPRPMEGGAVHAGDDGVVTGSLRLSYGQIISASKPSPPVKIDDKEQEVLQEDMQIMGTAQKKLNTGGHLTDCLFQSHNRDVQEVQNHVEILPLGDKWNEAMLSGSSDMHGTHPEQPSEQVHGIVMERGRAMEDPCMVPSSYHAIITTHFPSYSCGHSDLAPVAEGEVLLLVSKENILMPDLELNREALK
ncbi:hypothetical protein Taro_019176 [Colocasia esculenta]|uniref:Uncharacterized protein n=1 Tax=Colocasia esculenta TaxID=4460 RepID=A0A843UKG3_COLES|nr:hypothetical protein [Colocasia esculenta]